MPRSAAAASRSWGNTYPALFTPTRVIFSKPSGKAETTTKSNRRSFGSPQDDSGAGVDARTTAGLETGTKSITRNHIR